MMSKFIAIFSAVVLGAVVFMASPEKANAMVFNMADKNPQVVAYYPTGPHGIPGEPYYHSGADLVKLNGQSGGLQQWFYGMSEEGGMEGDHSVWKVSGNGTCASGWVLVTDAYPEWGDYLMPNTDYCVQTNDFGPTGH